MLTDEPFVGSDFTAEDIATIGALLEAGGGVVLDRYNNACIKRRIAARMRDLQLNNAAAYIDKLRSDRDEAQRLSALLSLHVSSFYRDPTTFAALRKILQERAQAGRPLQRCWSAGCAAGEEAYSLALLVSQLPELRPVSEILGTDVSHEILEKARWGSFDPARLQNLSPAELSNSFVAGKGDYRINAPFRSMVRFVRHDLLPNASYPPVDLILCRYVLIYFTVADQEQVLQRFAAALPSGGILILGRTETLRDPAGLFTVIDANERIYQRI